MVTITVHQLIHDEKLGINPKNPGLRDRRFADAAIYLVRDGSTVFYIGKSDTDVVERLRVHMGWEFRGKRSKSDLGRLIEANLPDATSWTVELLTTEECRWSIPSGGDFVFIHSRDAEWCMIRYYKPCLNVVANNYRATPLPERYKRPATWL